MKKIRVSLKTKRDCSYDIHIGKGIFSSLAQTLKKKRIANKYAVITDNIVAKLYGKQLLSLLRSKDINADMIVFKSGEESKNLDTFKELIEKVHSLGLDRSSAIIALGGGVVGDIAGFVAACYMRGISLVQVPTTLLAMVDSSIGGKVAVDLKSGKNSCGSFLQPREVFIDVSMLNTLPHKELLNGIVETIKHAMIKDSGYLDFITKNVDSILARDADTLTSLITTSCKVKAEVVEKDEKEQNIRKILNYGHTIGHAIETLTRYKKFSHGEAVAIGMNVESNISNMMGFLPSEHITKQNNLLKSFGLKTKLPRLSISSLVDELRKDKKAVSGKVQFALPQKVGKMKSINGRYGIFVPNSIIISALEGSR